MNLQQSDFQCSICLNVLNSPIQLSPCSSFVCSQCLIKWFELSNSNKCPVCHHHSLTTADINPLEDMRMRLIHGLLIKCQSCNQNLHSLKWYHTGIIVAPMEVHQYHLMSLQQPPFYNNQHLHHHLCSCSNTTCYYRSSIKEDTTNQIKGN
jgi:RNA polymerase subunit RPABC4/transcription elongation factor Spt4